MKNSALTRAVITNTFLPPEKQIDKIEVLVARIIADALDAVFEDTSVSDLRRREPGRRVWRVVTRPLDRRAASRPFAAGALCHARKPSSPIPAAWSGRRRTASVTRSLGVVYGNGVGPITVSVERRSAHGFRGRPA